MGKSTGAVRAQAGRVGLSLRSLSSGGYVLRGTRARMEANTLAEAQSLIRSASGGRTRGNFRVGDTIAPADSKGWAQVQFAARVVSVTREGYTVAGNRFVPRGRARRVVN